MLSSYSGFRYDCSYFNIDGALLLTIVPDITTNTADIILLLDQSNRMVRSLVVLKGEKVFIGIIKELIDNAKMTNLKRCRQADTA